MYIRINPRSVTNLEISMAFIITELVYICLGASWRTPPGARIFRCIEDLLVTFCCCLLYGRGFVSLAYSPFPFSILLLLVWYCVLISNLYNSKIQLFSDNVSRYVKLLLLYPPYDLSVFLFLNFWLFHMFLPSAEVSNSYWLSFHQTTIWIWYETLLIIAP